MSTKNLIGMHWLNPTHNLDDDVFMGFFPPTDEYYTELLQDKTFENFLMQVTALLKKDRTELQIFIKLHNCGKT